MKKINTYIIEKLKINNDSTINHHNLKYGDVMLRVLYNNYRGMRGDKKCKILLGGAGEYMPYFFHGIGEEGDITFTHWNVKAFGHVDRYPNEKDIFVNSNGFYEYNFSKPEQEKYCYALYLDKETGISFIKDICLDFDNNQNKLKQYFDQKDNIEKDLELEPADKDNLKTILHFLEKN